MTVIETLKTKKLSIGAILFLITFSIFTEIFYEPKTPDYTDIYEYGRVVSVTDGDTLRVKVKGQEMKVRLIGIGTPETNHPNEPLQCFGPEAKRALEQLVLYKEVRMEKDVSDKDRYDRYLRYLWLGDLMVNEYMVKNGFAFSLEYKPDIKYQEILNLAQEQAEKDDLGLWSVTTCDGDVYSNLELKPLN